MDTTQKTGAAGAGEAAGLPALPTVSGCPTPIDALTAKAQQLESLLFMMHGAQLETFLDVDQDIQDGLTWLAACLAGDVRTLARAVGHGWNYPGGGA